jgi:hypothetical protein
VKSNFLAIIAIIKNQTNSIAAALVLSALQAPAAELDLKVAADPVYVHISMWVSHPGEYALDYSLNLKDWYVHATYNISGNLYTIDDTPSYPDAPLAAFYRLRDVAADPAAGTYFRRTDTLAGMRVVTSSGTQTLEFTDMRTSAVQQLERIAAADGSLGAFGSAYEMVAYAIHRPGQTSQTILRSLTNPAVSLVLNGDLQAMWRRTNNQVMLLILRDFAGLDSGIQYNERLALDSSRSNFTTEDISFQNGAAYDPRVHLVAGTRSFPVTGGYRCEVNIYDISAGLTSPQKLYTADLGTYASATPVYLGIPRQMGSQQFVMGFSTGSNPAETVLLAPRQQAFLRLPLLSSSFSCWFEENQATFFGTGSTGAYAEAFVKLEPLTLLPARTFPTDPLVLQNFDGTSVLQPLYGNDGVYTFTDVSGEGVEGSRAVRVDFLKTVYPYSYIVGSLSDQSVDFSLYDHLSVRVKNLADKPLGLILKVEHINPYIWGGVYGWVEQSFTIPASSDWTTITLNAPENGTRGIFYLSKSFLMFAAPGQSTASGSFLLDDVRLVP